MSVTPGLHCPVPSQANAPTTASPLQVPFMQVLPMYFRQPPAPSQKPSRPQVMGESTGQVEAVRGAAPADRMTQVPGEAGAEQVAQPPEQAVAQQTPSTQWPLSHSASQPQLLPVSILGPLAPQADTTWSRPPSTWGDPPPAPPCPAAPPSGRFCGPPWPPQPPARASSRITAAAAALLQRRTRIALIKPRRPRNL